MSNVSVASASKIPRQLLTDVLLFVAADDGRDESDYVAMRFDFVQLAGLDE